MLIDNVEHIVPNCSEALKSRPIQKSSRSHPRKRGFGNVVWLRRIVNDADPPCRTIVLNCSEALKSSPNQKSSRSHPRKVLGSRLVAYDR